MPNYRIILEYDGTNYVGWQRQENGLSIQQLVEEAIEKLTKQKIILFGAGRTDAGVHARGQVANFELQQYFDSDTIRDGINHYLRPQPISILSAEETDKDFNSRFSAKLRWYEYKIINRRSPITLEQNKVWCVHKKIDTEKLIKQSQQFIGKFDLSAFRSINCQSKSPIKSINSIDINCNKDEINFLISAKSFLHSQVRIMVGTLVEIGLNKIEKSISEIIKSKRREHAGVTAPPEGLYLIKIDY